MRFSSLQDNFSWQFHLGIAGKRPFAVDLGHQAFDFSQAGFHITAQSAQIGRGVFGVRGDGLRIDQNGIDFSQAGAGLAQHGIELNDGGTRLGQHAFVAKHLAVGFGSNAVEFGQQ